MNFKRKKNFALHQRDEKNRNLTIDRRQFYSLRQGENGDFRAKFRYLEKRQRTPLAATRPSRVERVGRKSAANAIETKKPIKARKLSFKEARELEGMEAAIRAVETEIVRIESLFASPDFYRTHATQTNQLKADLESAKEELTRLFARWEELEAIRLGSICPPAR